MKKFFQPETVSLITIVAALISLTAQVALAQEGNFENIGVDYEGGIVVITDAGGGNTVTYCGRELTEYKAVVIPVGGRSIVTTVAITPSEVVKAGDRFDITIPTVCDGRISVSLVRKRPERARFAGGSS